MKKCFLLLLGVLIFAGCANSGPESENKNVSVETAVKGFRDQTASGDIEISGFRMIILNEAGTSVLKNERLPEDASESDQTVKKYRFRLNTGTYKVCAVANETADMTARLDGVTNYDDLKTIQVSGSFTPENIPLYKDLMVIVRADKDSDVAMVSTDGGQSWSSELSLVLPRTQTMVSLHLRKKTGNNDVIVVKKAEICKVPDLSYLIQRPYAPTEEKLRTLTPYDDPNGIVFDTDITDESLQTNYTKIFDSNNILPEKILVDSGDDQKAAYLKIYATYNGVNTVYMVKLRGDLNIANYNLVRNVHYQVFATMQGTGDLELAHVYIKPVWWGEDVDGDIQAPYLNVSETVTSFLLSRDDAGNVPVGPNRIYFWGNIPSSEFSFGAVTQNELGNTYPTDSLFDVNIQFSKEEVVGNKYSTAGYVEITPKETLGPLLFNGDAVRYSVALVAGNLKQNLWFQRQQFNNTLPFTKMPWVGVVYEYNQKGERIISAANKGPWSAEVEYPSGVTSNFVQLSLTSSLDQSLGSEDPEDAENYPVENGFQSVSTDGRIYFRVGLTDKLASSTSVRAARIKLTTESGVYYLYVRQGTESVPLMTVTDPAYEINPDGSRGGTVTRPSAQVRKIDPKNRQYTYATASRFKGGPTLAEQYKTSIYNTSTTSFSWNYSSPTPSTYSGGFICWNNYNVKTSPKDSRYYESYYFHPTNPQTGPIVPYPHTDVIAPPATWNTANQYRDICTVSNSTYTAIHPTVDHFRYSLFQNVPALAADGNYAMATNAEDRNYAFGYLADGAFDRRTPYSITSNTGTATLETLPCATGEGLSTSYNGLLFYNPNTYVSVFFPAAGFRDDTTGELRMAGIGGFLWTKSTESATDKWGLQFSNINGTLDCRIVRGVHPARAASVRCVR